MATNRPTEERAQRRFILGTAGHVDHGKTELVRALTGCETDRLKEEKARGISIELGFAPLRLDDQTFIGIIDVPGHERFVKQMVAGAGGIDMAMLLIAADEGVMPQTEEHMEVLASLRVGCGLVVISKSDLASADTTELLREEIAEVAAGTFLEKAPVVAVSSKTGAGIDALKSELLALSEGIAARDTSGPFRLAVDRVFHQKGIGVVVTGSGYSGTISVGDSLELLPAGQAVRVRELQSFGEKRTQGSAGERLALALQGVKLDEVHRGDMLATPSKFAATRAVDVRIQLADYYAFELKNRERVRIHHGAREVLGRVIILENDAVGAGDSALAQLKLETPLVAGENDYFVLRKYSPPRVIGGGVVIDPNPERHKRFDSDAIDRLQIKEQGDPEAVLSKAIERSGLEGLAGSGVDAAALTSLVDCGAVVRIGKRVFSSAVVDLLAERVDDLASEFIAGNPLQWGIDKEELRQRVGFPHGTPSFNGVLDELARRRPIFVRGNRVRSGTDEIELSESLNKELDALRESIKRLGVTFSSRERLEQEWPGRAKFQDLLQFLKDAGDVIELGDGGVIHRGALDRCIGALRSLFEQKDEITVGDLKTGLDLSRKYAIPLLEYFDSVHITTRVENTRIKGAKFPP